MGQGLTKFPYCNCDFNAAHSPYYVKPQVDHPAPNTYTFTLGVRTCNFPNNPCCKTTADVQKLEFAIRECWHLVLLLGC